jgi:hypothetical protein
MKSIGKIEFGRMIRASAMKPLIELAESGA